MDCMSNVPPLLSPSTASSRAFKPPSTFIESYPPNSEVAYLRVMDCVPHRDWLAFEEREARELAALSADLFVSIPDRDEAPPLTHPSSHLRLNMSRLSWLNNSAT